MLPNIKEKKLSQMMVLIWLVLTMLSLCQANLPSTLLPTFVKSFRAPKPLPIFNDISSHSMLQIDYFPIGEPIHKNDSSYPM